MLLRARYTPRHRGEPVARPRRAGRIAVVSLATLGTGGAISAGVLAERPDPATTPATASATVAGDDRELARLRAERETTSERASRSGGRESLTAADAESPSDEDGPDRTKMLTLAPEAGGAVTGVDDLADADPREIARGMLGEFGFGADQFGCLDQLWVSESDWEVDADNPTSSAYGIPQALTGGTHDDLPADYMTNPVSQIRWGLGYIRDAYGTPCSAWSFKQANNWY